MNEDERESSKLEGLYARVRGDLDRERGVRAWLRSRPTWLRVALVAASAAGAIATACVMMGAPLPPARLDGWACSVVAVIMVLAIAIVGSLRPLQRPDAGIGTRLWLVGLGAASLVAIVMANDGSLGSAASTRCLMLGAMVGVPVWLAEYLVDRAPERNVGLGGAVAALGGMVAAQILCPLRGLAHLAVDHFGALLVLSAAFGVARWLAARFERARTTPGG